MKNYKKIKLLFLSIICLVFIGQVNATTKVTIGSIYSQYEKLAPLPVKIEARNQSDIVGIQLEIQGYFYSMWGWEYGAAYKQQAGFTSETFFNSSNQSDIIFVDFAPLRSSKGDISVYNFDITGVRLIKSDGSDLKESEFLVVDGVVDFSTSDPDFDNDGVTNFDENNLGMDIYSADSDGDGIPDSFEYAHANLDPTVNDAGGDIDGDGLSNLEEYLAGYDMTVADTDLDGMDDGDELAIGRDPLVNEPAILVVVNGLLLG